MIHLDANYLILGANVPTVENAHVRRWLAEGEPLATSAVAWMEFVTGPVTASVIEVVRNIVEDRIVSVGREEAELAAELFNVIGRKRSARYDCIIAAAAICTGARLGTTNLSDYRAFTARGLQLA